MGDTLVILPTYNEKENIAGVLDGVLSQDPRIEALVVDDASPDGTSEIVRKKYNDDERVHLLVRTRLRGRGFAGIAGFRWAAERDYRYIVEMDADGSHNPSYLPELIEALGRADIAVCSRLIGGGGEKGRPFYRRWITIGANFYVRVVLGFSVKDCTGGYRGYRREVIEAIPWDKVHAGGPSLLQEVMFIAGKKGFSMEEIPYIFEERHRGSSKLKPRLLMASLFETILIRRRHGQT